MGQVVLAAHTGVASYNSKDFRTASDVSRHRSEYAVKTPHDTQSQQAKIESMPVAEARRS